MKIKEFRITKLFGTFNHTLTFNTEKGVTIVIGENGLGKTIMLEMINYFFNKEFFYWSQVLFHEVEIEFEDEEIWKITCKHEPKKKVNSIYVTSKNKSKSISIPIEMLDMRNRKMMHSMNRLHFIERIGPDEYIDNRIGDLIDRETLYRRYADRLSGRYGISLFDDEDTNHDWEKTAWFKERIEANKVHLINTQRILSVDKERTESTVKKHAKLLSEMIKKCLAKSTEESSKLDRTFPNRLLAKIKANSDANNTDVLYRLDELEKKRKLLDRVGLIEISTDFTGITQDQLGDSEVNNTLLLYIEDSFSKLSVFDELSNKLELFIDIINKRFKHKKLFISKDHGFEFKSSVVNDEKSGSIPIEKLSSGEQNELVLFFELLFKSNDKSLVLIDEPEISLHISWQNCFITDIKEITRINKIDILIATHSPDIIADNWDLKVELKGIE